LLTDPKLRSQVDALWDKFWTGGLANPLDAIEQFSYSVYRPEGSHGQIQSIDKNLRDVLSKKPARLFSGATIYD